MFYFTYVPFVTLLYILNYINLSHTHFLIIYIVPFNYYFKIFNFMASSTINDNDINMEAPTQSPIPSEFPPAKRTNIGSNEPIQHLVDNTSNANQKLDSLVHFSSGRKYFGSIDKNVPLNSVIYTQFRYPVFTADTPRIVLIDAPAESAHIIDMFEYQTNISDRGNYITGIHQMNWTPFLASLTKIVTSLIYTKCLSILDVEYHEASLLIDSNVRKALKKSTTFEFPEIISLKLSNIGIYVDRSSHLPGFVILYIFR